MSTRNKKTEEEKTTAETAEKTAEKTVEEAAETAVKKAFDKTVENAPSTPADEADAATEANGAIKTDEAAAVPAQVVKPRGDKVLTKKQKRMRTALRWALLLTGILMMSCSVYFFQTPNNFTLGGVAGIAILLSSFIHLSQGVIMAIINVFLLILGLIILGKQCTIRTIFCSLMYTGIIWLFEYLDVLGHIPNTFLHADGVITLTDQPFLELVYAILLFGVGGALIFNCGASSGGTDIIALILKKFTKLNVGFALMLIDLIVVCVSFYTFETDQALFSLLGLFTKSFLLDGVIESMGKTKYITIITTRPEDISDYILNVIKHGYTMYDAQGGYTGESKKVLITVCKRGEALKLKAKVKQIDGEAFVIITDANEILGKGFGGTI